MLIDLTLDTPRWALPLLGPSRYKAAWGGRAGGKSYFFAQLLISEMVADPDLFAVCVREVQKSIKDSVKKLLEETIEAMGVGHLFEPLKTEIRRIGGSGMVVFTGIQNHTAASIKGLQGANVCWIDEAETISEYSLALLEPTIRAEGSEIWASWNPRYPDDPIDRLFRGPNPPDDARIVTVSSWDNPWLSSTARRVRDNHQQIWEPDKFAWIYGGAYRTLGDDLVIAHKVVVAPFTPSSTWDGPYYGADWGYSADPTAAVRFWRHDGRLWIEYESYAYELSLNGVAERWLGDIPGIGEGAIYADPSRPESIAHVKRMGISGLRPAPNWPGSVEDGIEHLKSYQSITVHPRCENWIYEAQRWAWKTTEGGTPTGKLKSGHDHLMDATRYPLAGLIRNKSGPIAGSPISRPRVSGGAWGIQSGHTNSFARRRP